VIVAGRLDWPCLRTEMGPICRPHPLLSLDEKDWASGPGEMAMSGNLDTAKLKAMAISMWKRGELDTLVRVAPRGMIPNPAYTAGYRTTFKYIVGRSPAEIEEIVGLAKGSKLVGGADVFIVNPLPSTFRILCEGGRYWIAQKKSSEAMNLRA
jgi:hypothetical protein